MDQPEAQSDVVDYTQLPERVALEDTITTQESRVGPDPTMGRDTETEFLLRNAG
ncbi:heme biosynthesis protein HemY [Cellulomonas sp. NS3]|uniref:heme biosynthesis protein HemY n=1 Tax=Cellulomonas sp. NS3 TaxID=2973977 RepID=UPI00216283B4|nr:heme biosynthesis protein HemY [Cellulomonas sp. NS3]